MYPLRHRLKGKLKLKGWTTRRMGGTKERMAFVRSRKSHLSILLGNKVGTFYD